MSHTLYKDAVIVVCDAAKALFFKNEGDEFWLNLRCYDVIDSEDLNDSFVYQDAPGRVHESHGVSRSSVGSDDKDHLVLLKFIERIADHLENDLESITIDQLTIVAPPRMMGQIRANFPHTLLQRISFEISNDLTGLPVEEIEKHLKTYAETR